MWDCTACCQRPSFQIPRHHCPSQARLPSPLLLNVCYSQHACDSTHALQALWQTLVPLRPRRLARRSRIPRRTSFDFMFGLMAATRQLLSLSSVWAKSWISYPQDPKKKKDQKEAQTVTISHPKSPKAAQRQQCLAYSAAGGGEGPCTVRGPSQLWGHARMMWFFTRIRPNLPMAPQRGLHEPLAASGMWDLWWLGFRVWGLGFRV